MEVYSYLIADLAILLIWLVIFLWRKDLRKELLIMSCIFGFAGLIAEPIYILDWWHPLTLTHTHVGLEDFIFGFAGGGIAAVMYEAVSGTALSSPVRTRRLRKPTKLFFFLSFPLCFFGSFFLLGLHSFSASVLAFVPSIAMIWTYRKDLITDSAISGILMIGIGFIWFWSAEFFNPNWVHEYWSIGQLSGMTIGGAPLEDLLWGFLVGAYVGPLYEFWNELYFARTRT